MSTQLALSGIQDIDGVLWGGWRWAGTPTTITNLTYSFPTSINEYSGYGPITGFEAFSAVQQAATTRAIEMVDSVCGLNITLTTTPGAGNLRFAEATLIDYNDGFGAHGPGGSNLSAESNPPDDTSFAPYTQGDAWFTHGNYENPGIGDYEATAGILHELGHNVGLKHGHEGGAGGNNTVLVFDHDSQEYSVMTYRAYPGQPAPFYNPVDYPTTLMQDDIAALQYLYGADYGYNSGNTTYRWNPVTGEMLVNGHAQNFTDNVFGGIPSNNKIFETIWDGGGLDVYDFSNYTTVVRANLNPGQWSTPSTVQLADLGLDSFGVDHVARGSIANALLFHGDVRSYIENAIGGSNNDTLIGNNVSNRLEGRGGNDNLYGAPGNDVLSGGAGWDYLNGGIGSDTAAYGDKVNSVVVTLNGTTAVIVKVNGIYEDTIVNMENVNGGIGNDVLTGDGLANILFGNVGIDSLSGGLGNDSLIGGLGNDTLAGGAGSDVFRFEAALSAANIDKITDFNIVDDSISLENAVFTLLATLGTLALAQFRDLSLGAQDADDVVIYNKTNGNIFYDSNGLTAGGLVQFADVTDGLTLTNLDFFVT
jgi:serralysin